MIDVGRMIRTLREERNWSQTTLAKHLGCSRQAISLYENNLRGVDFITLEALADIFNVPVTFFVSEERKQQELEQIYSTYNLPNDLHPLPIVNLPILGPIAAGEPILADPASETVHVIGNTKASAGLIVCGDSMIPDFFDGDIVLIRLQDDVDDGQIAAVAIDDTVALKRVYHVSGGVQLISSNPQYPPMFFGANNCDSVRIIGLAVGFQRAL